MSLMIRKLTRRDLKYYYFYYTAGWRGENLREGNQIFYHVFDNLAIEFVETILKRVVKKYRPNEDDPYADKLSGATLYRFYPHSGRVGPRIKLWNKKGLESLVPRKRKTRVKWYFVHAILTVAKEDANIRRTLRKEERDVRSPSFPAISAEEAVKKGKEWLAGLKKGLKSNEHLYMASIHYANRARVDNFHIPDTSTNLLS